MRMAKAGKVLNYGMDDKDEREDALAWLREWGNPYTVVAVDESGRVGIDYGVYGVPETYVTEKVGVICHKQMARCPRTPCREALVPDQGIAETMRMRWLFVTILLLPSLGGVGETKLFAANPQVKARLKALAVELGCLICQNQTLADSNAPFAKVLRREVQDWWLSLVVGRPPCQ